MANLAGLEPGFRPYAETFVQWLRANGVSVVVTSAKRTQAEQQRLYDRAKSGQSAYPAAKPGNSYHEVGLAFDLALDGVTPKQDPDLYREAGRAWEAYGGKWGGRFSRKDEIHFQAPSRYASGEVKSEGIGPLSYAMPMGNRTAVKVVVGLTQDPLTGALKKLWGWITS